MFVHPSTRGFDGPGRPLPVEHGRQPARDDDHRRAPGDGRRARAPPGPARPARPRRRRRARAARAAAARARAHRPRRGRALREPVEDSLRRLLLRHGHARPGACCARSSSSPAPTACWLGSDHPFDMADPRPGGDRARRRPRRRGRGGDPRRQRGAAARHDRARPQIVVAGAGHNSLITAAYLAVAGLRGARARRARRSRAAAPRPRSCSGPGYLIDSCSTGHTLIQTNPLLLDDELGLLGALRARVPAARPVRARRVPGRRAPDRVARPRAHGRGDRALLARTTPTPTGRLLDEYDEVKHIFAAGQFTPIGFGPSVEQLLRRAPARATSGCGGGR